MDREQQLKDIFRRVGRFYGFDKVESTFSPMADVKVTWARSAKNITFEVCDYLEDAPFEVIWFLADTIFKRIRSLDEDIPYSKDVIDWLTRPDMRAKWVDRYISRKGCFSPSPIGDSKDLNDSYERLVAKGLVERDPDITLRWLNDADADASGMSSVLMRVIGVSKVLDEETVSDDLIDYVVYSKMVPILIGFDPRSRARLAQVENMLDRFPMRSRMETMLHTYFSQQTEDGLGIDPQE